MEEDHVGVAVVQDTSRCVKQCAAATGIARPASVVERHRDAHFKQPSRDHPRQCAVAVAGNLVILWPPTVRQAEALAFVVAQFQTARPSLFQACFEKVGPSAVCLNVGGIPRRAGDEAHRRSAGRRLVAHVAEERGQSRCNLDQRHTVEVARLPVVECRLRQDRQIEVVDQLAGLPGVTALDVRQIAEAHGSPPPAFDHQIPRDAGLLRRLVPRVAFTALAERLPQQVRFCGGRWRASLSD